MSNALFAPFVSWRDPIPPEDLPLRNAYHEAGHALVASRYKIDVLELCGGLRNHHVHMRPLGSREELFVTLAGIAAEERTPGVGHKVSRDVQRRWRADLEDFARDLAVWNENNPDDRLTEAECWARVRHILNEPFLRWALPQVADFLQERGDRITAQEEWDVYFYCTLSDAWLAERDEES